MEKIITIKNSDFKKIKELTKDGWVVLSADRVSDSKTQYRLTKPNMDNKIMG